VTVTTMLQRGLEHEHDQAAQDDHASHDGPEHLAALFAFGALERVARMTGVAVRALLRAVGQKVFVILEQLLAVETDELGVVADEAAHERQRRKLAVLIGFERVEDFDPDFGGGRDLFDRKPAPFPFVS